MISNAGGINPQACAAALQAACDKAGIPLKIAVLLGDDLIDEKEDLLAPVPEGAVSAPHPMVEGTEDGDYYRGQVTGSTQAQIDWVRAQRPDDPSLAGARAKATPTASGWGAKQTVKGAVR